MKRFWDGVFEFSEGLKTVIGWMLAFAGALIIPIAGLYLLVRFVRWAWMN